MCRLEIRLLAQLDHENIVKMISHRAYKARSSDKYPTYVVIKLEKCESDLQAFLLENRLDTDESFRNAYRQIGLALEFMHSKRIAHHDMKPGNIMIQETSEVDPCHFQYKLILAKEYSKHIPLDQITDTKVWGTHAYMPIEKHFGFYNPFAADVYAFGVTMLKCWNGLKRDPSSPRQKPSDEMASLVREGLVPRDLERLLYRTVFMECARPQMAEAMAIFH